MFTLSTCSTLVPAAGIAPTSWFSSISCTVVVSQAPLVIAVFIVRAHRLAHCLRFWRCYLPLSSGLAHTALSGRDFINALSVLMAVHGTVARRVSVETNHRQCAAAVIELFPWTLPRVWYPAQRCRCRFPADGFTGCLVLPSCRLAVHRAHIATRSTCHDGCGVLILPYTYSSALLSRIQTIAGDRFCAHCLPFSPRLCRSLQIARGFARDPRPIERSRCLGRCIALSDRLPSGFAAGSVQIAVTLPRREAKRR